jgi:hypothetical protein
MAVETIMKATVGIIAEKIMVIITEKIMVIIINRIGVSFYHHVPCITRHQYFIYDKLATDQVIRR